MCPAGMRLIPAGMFLMGDVDLAPPVHGVRLSEFCMDEAEVTVADYRTCAECTAPTVAPFCNWAVAGRENHPVNCVDWAQARAYCQSRGSDLPTEAQWEYAARGTDGRRYPWGNDAPASQLCWNRYPVTGSSCRVKSYSVGSSPYGLFDMSGNVFEWTLDWYAVPGAATGSYISNPTGPVTGILRVIKGGSWADSDLAVVRASYRGGESVDNRNNVVGFRCSRGSS